MSQQARAVETRSVIIRAAADVFAMHGYGGTSLADICLAAGMTKGALYFHFASKEALALAIIQAQHELAITPDEELLDDALGGLEVLMRMSYRLAAQLRDDPVSRAGIRLTLEASSLTTPVVTPYEEWITSCDRMLRRAINDGDVRATADVAAAARFIGPAFTGVQMVAEVLTGRQDLIQRVGEMWSFVLPSLVVPERWEKLRGLPQELANGWADRPPAR